MFYKNMLVTKNGNKIGVKTSVKKNRRENNVIDKSSIYDYRPKNLPTTIGKISAK